MQYCFNLRGVMSNQLVNTRDNDDMIANTWHRCSSIGWININVYSLAWLQSDEMQGRWSIPTGLAYGIYFESLDDFTMFTLTWS